MGVSGKSQATTRKQILVIIDELKSKKELIETFNLRASFHQVAGWTKKFTQKATP